MTRDTEDGVGRWLRLALVDATGQLLTAGVFPPGASVTMGPDYSLHEASGAPALVEAGRRILLRAGDRLKSSAEGGGDFRELLGEDRPVELTHPKFVVALGGTHTLFGAFHADASAATQALERYRASRPGVP